MELPHASNSVCFALHGAADGWGLLQRGAFALLLLDSPQAHKHLVYSGCWKPAVNQVSLNFYRESQRCVKHNLSLRRRRCCYWGRLFSTPVRATALNQLVRETSWKSEAASMQQSYLCVSVSYCDVTLACIPVMLCVYVHLNTSVYMILHLYACVHQTLRVCRRRNVPEQMEITSEQQEETEIEQRGGFI